jgi:hypothetical protein
LKQRGRRGYRSGFHGRDFEAAVEIGLVWGWIEAERLSENVGKFRFKKMVEVGSVRSCQGAASKRKDEQC